MAPIADGGRTVEEAVELMEQWEREALENQRVSADPPMSFFWQTVWTVVALSGIVRWPVGALVYLGGAVAYFWAGDVFWGILWLAIIGVIVSGIVGLLVAVPFFVLGVLLACVLVTIRWMWGYERRAVKRLPFEIRRRG